MNKIGQYAKHCWILLLIACGAETPTIEKVLSIKEMGALATTEYTVTKIVKANDNQTWFKVGDRKILISVEASIKAGIDLSSLTAENVQISGKSIRLQLPAPKIILMELPPDKIKLEYEEVGLLRTGFDAAERLQLLQQAEQQIKASIPATGILETARTHTRDWITRFYQQLGFENIQIDFEDQPNQPTLQ